MALYSTKFMDKRLLEFSRFFWTYYIENWQNITQLIYFETSVSFFILMLYFSLEKVKDAYS